MAAATIVTLADFRARMKGTPFADSDKYNDDMVEFWLEVAEMCHNAARWKNFLPVAICLWVCHQITLDGIAAMEAARGGVAGIRNGMIQSESGDSVSVSFDVSGSSEGEKAGYYNSTIYGKRWWRFAMMFGAGPLVVGTGGGAGEQYPGAGTPLY